MRAKINTRITGAPWCENIEAVTLRKVISYFLFEKSCM